MSLSAKHGLGFSGYCCLPFLFFSLPLFFHVLHKYKLNDSFALAKNCGIGLARFLKRCGGGSLQAKSEFSQVFT